MPAAFPGEHEGTNTPAVLRDDVDAVAVLTLNRPDARNTLSDAMLAALAQTLDSIAQDDRIRAIVLAANGAAFCAGHDLKELTARRGDPDGGRAYFTRVMESCSALMQQIVGLPQPIVAAVEATATAAGCQLVASCDLAVASSTAKFCTPGVDIGLFCSTPMVALSRNVARKHAMEMLLTGEAVSAEHAQRIGLVNRVVAAGAARQEALRLAQTISSKSTMTVRIGKNAFYRQLELELGEAYRLASQVMVDNMLREDAREGIAAFLDKRPPHWKNR